MDFVVMVIFAEALLLPLRGKPHHNYLYLTYYTTVFDSTQASSAQMSLSFVFFAENIRPNKAKPHHFCDEVYVISPIPFSLFRLHLK